MVLVAVRLVQCTDATMKRLIDATDVFFILMGNLFICALVRWPAGPTVFLQVDMTVLSGLRHRLTFSLCVRIWNEVVIGGYHSTQHNMLNTLIIFACSERQTRLNCRQLTETISVTAHERVSERTEKERNEEREKILYKTEHVIVAGRTPIYL